MRKIVIALVAALGISLASAAPAKAQFWGGYYGGWGGYGYGAYGAMAGAALLGGVIGGAIASQSYGYGYGYPYGYGYTVGVPVYNYPGYRSAPPVRKQVIIKNSPGARVYEEDDFGW